MAMLQITNLSKEFTTSKGLLSRESRIVKAVNNVSLTIDRNETLGIVGESGSGKTTLGRAVLRLIEPSSGSVNFDGVDVLALSKQQMRQFRKRMQIVFQDSSSTLDARWTIGKTLIEGLKTHFTDISAAQAQEKTAFLMETVGLPADYIYKYPHELSGGQRQRIGIAKAISVEPELIVADEPVSALDVSVQAQILNLLQELKKSRSLSYMFISHDLSVIKFISDRVCVMYLGYIVEMAESNMFFSNPLHPYSHTLLEAIPIPEAGRRIKSSEQILKNNDDIPKNGCPFCPRCPHASDICKSTIPPLRDVGAGHLVACHNQMPVGRVSATNEP